VVAGFLLSNKQTQGSKPMIADRMAFRLTPEDQQNVATIAARIQPNATFVSRTDVMRAALKALAERIIAETGQEQGR
jgi:hypothetical protein